MRLKEWDTSSAQHGAYIEREYPDAIVKAFIDWTRNTRQWREAPELVYQRWLKMERELADFRNAAPVRIGQQGPGAGGGEEGVEAPPDVEHCTALTKAGAPCKGKAVQDGLCMSHLRALVPA